MYTKEQLEKYPYFNNLFVNYDLQLLLDPLTQVIQRTYILGFIKDCIENRIPFTMAILDLDNFKAINDNYGHASGDGVLFDVAQSLSKYLGKDGLVGRYGGDEFIFVYLKTNNYQQIHSLYSTMFEEGHVLRKNVKLKNCSPFITGTIGSASYPEDAKDYNDLFSMSDKTLYRGKMKGRNCFIIYLAAKHAQIMLKNESEKSYTSMEMLSRVMNIITKNENIKTNIDSVLRFFISYLQEDHVAIECDTKTCAEAKHVLCTTGNFKHIDPALPRREMNSYGLMFLNNAKTLGHVR